VKTSNLTQMWTECTNHLLWNHHVPWNMVISQASSIGPLLPG
jgi:hypothetical protein